MSIVVGIEGFVETKKNKQKAASKREALSRKSATKAQRVLYSLDSIGVTKKSHMEDGGGSYEAIKTPFFKIKDEYGRHQKKVCLRGVKDEHHSGPLRGDVELLVKVGDEKHVYASFSEVGKIQYNDELGFKPSRDNKVHMDKEVLEIVEAIAVTAEERYGIEV